MERIAAIRAWLPAFVGSRFELTAASEDASFRRYFRVRFDGQTRIVMDAPPDKEDIRPFIDIARRLESVGLHAPHIYEANLEQGFLLLSDLGTVSYLSRLDTGTVDALYADALNALARMQDAPVEHLPPYDESLLIAEMELFREWFMGRHLGMELDATLNARMQSIYVPLVASALAQPRVFVHRDYHSRNLMVIDDNNPGIIDFQDAVYGPVTYDLVSLLRDCYIDWPRHQVEAWALSFRDAAVKHGSLEPVGDREFLRWFDLMGVQRHLKAIGIFSRLNYRDDKPGYLEDIPRTLAYVVEVSGRYEELADLHKLVQSLGKRLADR